MPERRVPGRTFVPFTVSHPLHARCKMNPSMKRSLSAGGVSILLALGVARAGLPLPLPSEVRVSLLPPDRWGFGWSVGCGSCTEYTRQYGILEGSVTYCP